MSRTARPRALAALSAAALLAGAVAATAEEPAGTSTATIASITSGTTGPITVRGGVALSALPAVELGTDPTGDARVPGTDLVSASVEALGAGSTAFTIGLGNLAPAVGSAPAVTHHNWEFTVTAAGRSSVLSLKAINRGAVVGGTLDGAGVDQPVFALQTCSPDPQTGQRTCTSEYVEGAYTADGVRFVLPNGRLGATSGATITTSGQRINVSAGASDVVWLTNGVGGDTMGARTYTVPEGVVRAGLAPAGTPVEDVPLSGTADGQGTTYSVALPRPVAGEYVAVVQACQDGACGPRVSRPVTVR